MNVPIKRRRFLKWSGVGLGLGGFHGRRGSAQRFTPFVDLAITPSGHGLWTLDQMGKIVSFGDAPVFVAPPDPDKPVFVALGATPSGGGLYALTQEGNLKTWGDALHFDTAAARGNRIPFVDMAIAPFGDGLWALDLLGNVFSFGGAPVFTAPPDPDKPVFVALGATRSGGLYALTQQGNLKTFGRLSPPFDTAAARANHVPFVDMALTPSGDGLWALDLLGKIVSTGAAPVFITPPNPDKPIFVGLGGTASGGGLYALTHQGNLKTWGDATFAR